MTDGVLITLAVALGLVAASWGGWCAYRLRGRPAPSAGPEAGRAAATVRDGLAATRRRLGERLDALFGGRDHAAALQELEEALIGADVGVRTSGQIVEAISPVVRTGDSPEVRTALREYIVGLFPPAVVPPRVPTRIVLVTGVNGVGKTTTIGKLAKAAIARGQTVLLVAADTYRAAAIDQLEAWGRRITADVIRHGPGASPAAVAFDGATAGCARGIDLVLIDTAGRLHTRAPLMDELRKVRRVVAQVCPGAPHETLLVLDATTGQNAVRQAASFVDAVDVTGVVLTKLDGTAKGGVAVAIAAELKLPIAFVGVGEGPEDLRAFDAGEYADALLAAPGSG